MTKQKWKIFLKPLRATKNLRMQVMRLIPLLADLKDETFTFTCYSVIVEEEDIVDSDFDVDSGDSDVEREVEGQEEDRLIAKEERQVCFVVFPEFVSAASLTGYIG